MIFCRLFAILMVLAFVTAGLRAEDEPLTLEAVNARIQAIEASLMQAQGERARAKHEAEYGDPALTADRKAMKKVEGQLIELRRSYNERLYVLDPEIRALESTISSRHRQIADFQLLQEALGNELALADQSDSASSEELTTRLKGEKDELDTAISNAKVEILQSEKALAERQASVTAGDSKARELKSDLDRLQAEYTAAYDKLNTTVNQRKEVESAGDDRYLLAEELQHLRDLKNKLSAEGGN